MPVISEQLNKFFDEKMREYPTKRSFLVPMLLYTQDELGCITNEAITHLAKKTELTELEVRNVISYYSMLRTKPLGKYHVQVCWASATSRPRQTAFSLWKKLSASARAVGRRQCR